MQGGPQEGLIHHTQGALQKQSSVVRVLCCVQLSTVLFRYLFCQLVAGWKHYYFPNACYFFSAMSNPVIIGNLTGLLPLSNFFYRQTILYCTILYYTILYFPILTKFVSVVFSSHKHHIRSCPLLLPPFLELEETVWNMYTLALRKQVRASKTRPVVETLAGAHESSNFFTASFHELLHVVFFIGIVQKNKTQLIFTYG